MEDTKQPSRQYHHDLMDKIALLDKLWEKLATVNFRWDAEFLKRSGTLVEDLEKVIRYHKDEVMADKVMQLRERIRSCRTMGAHLPKVEEMRLTRRLEQVRYALRAIMADTDAKAPAAADAAAVAQSEQVFVVAAEDAQELMAKLGDGGFQNTALP